jgi:isopentenyl diphosphate isomerase/L-lactate dehydrogenase-like FMN-dependent dehydrogenase
LGTCEAREVKNPDVEDSSSYTYKCNKAIAGRIENAGAAAMMYCQIGGHHCEADWEKQIPIFMDYLWMH